MLFDRAMCTQVYRNADCARCNRVTSSDCYDERTPKVDVDEIRRELFGPHLPSPTIVLVIDLNAGTAEVHNSVPRRVPGADDPPPPPVAAVPLSFCRPGEVYDPYDDSCRPVGCSWDGSAAFGSNRVCPSTPTPEYFLCSFLCYATFFMSSPPSERCRGHSVFGRVRPCAVSLCVPKKTCEYHASKTSEGISPNFGHRYIWIHRRAD